VVQWKGVDRYADIERIVSIPAWIRNKAELSEVRPSKTSLKSDGQVDKPETPKAQPASLFDLPE
jgi:hypothetical protein